MTQQFKIITVDHSNVDTWAYCGANPTGHARKREWIRQCLPFGLRYKIAVESDSGAAAGMIEYMPAESAWRAVQAKNYFVIHCLQVPKKHAGQGLGSLLIQDCIRDAQSHGRDGVVALTTESGWCADRRIYLKNGFEVVDRSAPPFELLAYRLQGSELPSFGNWKQRAPALGSGIFLYNSKQCPFWRGERNQARQAWLRSKYDLDARIVEVDDSQIAQSNPCVWGTAGIVCNGEVINYVPGGDATLLKKLKRLKMIR